MENLIIIGSGISGLTAAIYAARGSLNPLVLAGDEAGGQLTLTTEVENFPGFPNGIKGLELIENVKKQAVKFGTRYVNETVKGFKVEKDYFEIETGENKYQSKAVIISTGASARTLGLESEKKYFGRGVSTCATCLPPEESIIVNSSIIEIQKVNPMTRVLTIDGTYQEIVGFNKRDYKGKLTKIKPRFFAETVSLTPNHPVLSVQAIRDYPHGKNVKFTKPKWVEAGSLKRGDCVLYPRIKETIDMKDIKISDFIDVRLSKGYAYPIVTTHTANRVKNIIKINEDFMRLMGYYIAEGSSYKHQIVFYFNKNEKEYIKDVATILKKTFRLEPHISYRDSICAITIYSKILADLFKHLFGSYAHKKRLPHWAILLPLSKQKELIKGLWRGDGCIRKKDFCYVTSSRELVYQMRDILLRMGIITGMQTRDKDKINKWINKIEGRLVGFNYTKYHLVVGGQFVEQMGKVLDISHPLLRKRKLTYKHSWIYNDFAILPIRKIENVDYEGPVLNIGVYGNQTYIAKNFIVHNCDAAFFKDKEVTVIGGGDAAMEEALTLTKFASKITIVHRRDEFRASKIMQDKALSNEKIKVIWDSVVEEVLGDGKLVTGIKVKNVKTGETSEIKCSGMFLGIGHVPNTKIFNDIIDTDNHGFIKTDNLMRTNVSGVFACGDVQDPVFKQAVTAAGSGCMAAIQAEKFIESEN